MRCYFLSMKFKKRDFRKQKNPRMIKLEKKKNLRSSKSKVVDVATTLLDALAGIRTRFSRTGGEHSTTEPQVLLPATDHRFRALIDMLSDYVNGNKRKTCFRNVTLYFRERLSLITSTENIKKIHASGTLTCVTAYVNLKLHLRKHFFPSTETWQKHVKKWYGSAVTVATETRLTSPYRQRKRVLTVVFPQRFHIFLPRFRSRIQLDISSCVNSTRRKIAVRNWVKNVAPFS